MHPNDIIGIILKFLTLTDFNSTCLLNKRWFKLSHRYYDLSNLRIDKFIRGSKSKICDISDFKYKQLKLNQTFDYAVLAKKHLTFYPTGTNGIYESFIARLTYLLKISYS